MSGAVTDAKYVVSLVVGDDYEFWKRDAERSLKWAARELLARGFSTDDAAEVLSAVWSAGRGEYGE